MSSPLFPIKGSLYVLTVVYKTQPEMQWRIRKWSKYIYHARVVCAHEVVYRKIWGSPLKNAELAIKRFRNELPDVANLQGKIANVAPTYTGAVDRKS